MARENISIDIIDSFQETLDSMTLFGIGQNYFGTLTAANQITQYSANFKTPFTKNITPVLFELKYHTRNILLAAAANNYEEAQESLNYMKEQSKGLRGVGHYDYRACF